MPGFDLDGFLPYQLSVLSTRISREFSTLYRRKYGISVAEWRVLAHLSQSDAVSVREITKRVDLDKSKVSRAATKLEQAGYLTKVVDPSDKRLVSLTLTTAGRELIDDIAPLAAAFEARVMSALGDEGKGFRAALARLLASVETDARPGG